MREFSNATIKIICAFAMILCLVFILGTTASAYQERYLVHESGYLEPGQKKSDAVYPTAGRLVGTIIGAAIVNASDNATGTVEFTMLPVYEKINVTTETNTQTIDSRYWPNGYTPNTYILENNTGYRIAYTIAVIERW